MENDRFAWLVVVQVEFPNGRQAIRRARVFTHFDAVTHFDHTWVLEKKVQTHFETSFKVCPEVIWFQRLPGDDRKSSPAEPAIE